MLIHVPFTYLRRWLWLHDLPPENYRVVIVPINDLACARIKDSMRRDTFMTGKTPPNDARDYEIAGMKLTIREEEGL